MESFAKRLIATDLLTKTGESVHLAGWIMARRDHGKLIFLDLRDRSGVVQLVVNPGVAAAAHEQATGVRSEYVVAVEGVVKERGERLINPNLATGTIEVEVTRLTIVSKAKTLPFELADTRDINEELRLKYRYLDLRSERLAQTIRLRSKVTNMVRDFLLKRDFVEIETPLLTKTSPEGARDFLVPSRLHPGQFYALPQSPQQYKQLLMIAGFERYFQIAKALRDEDARSDRQAEHTQIDMEMSFATEEEVRAIVEEMYCLIGEACGKKIWKKPFPVFTHEEAVAQFGQDKFDLRETKDPDVLAFAWVVDFPLFERDDKTGQLTFAHNPFSAPKPEHVEKLMRGEDLESLRAQQYDLVCNGYELASGGVRISDPTVQRKVFSILGLTEEQTEERFGHLLEAYEYGAPPHAGIAPGLERLIMQLIDEPSIREVIAFPQTSNGAAAVMEAPSPAREEQLRDLHLRIIDDASNRPTQ